MYESLIALQKIRDPAAGPGMAFLLRDLDEKVQMAALADHRDSSQPERRSGCARRARSRPHAQESGAKR